MRENSLPRLSRELLENLYYKQKLSANQIAAKLHCSAHRVNYWIAKYGLQKRSISEAIYTLYNPHGDPFTVKPIRTLEDAQLFGLGIGLYWGEGTKANKYAVRLGNTDPELLKIFLTFLIKLFGVKREDFRFGLQIFSDIDPQEAFSYWTRALSVSISQFYKVHVTISGSLGTYRKKSPYGVVTIYYQNKKLRDLLVNMLPR